MQGQAEVVVRDEQIGTHQVFSVNRLAGLGS